MTDWDALSPQEVERLARNIAPGEWAVERQRPISTLLGSCVAVCLFDPATRLGGMNHFMLPTMRRDDHHADDDMLLSGDYAMEALLNGLLNQGAARHRIQAKAFGGGTIISGMASAGIGNRNADFAREWLARERIELLAADLLGPWSRKLLFIPATGTAWCKRLPTTMATAQEIAREEANYAESLQRKPPPGNIELF
ncbi:chemotaxis protein CheD [Azoarcus sp. DD4]|uniref:chemotaxis protein CheD n=1 Tax=Azoarcus sp. DD4 TaxID=2027405 RepID=UPI0011279236|nr:chemotaxis protein CheD [Azoarcus sp. DD4]QDF95522.1 chemotaxis protein CheD [Azoarcus sp. DD4]